MTRSARISSVTRPSRRSRDKLRYGGFRPNGSNRTGLIGAWHDVMAWPVPTTCFFCTRASERREELF
jgi:hypothetical protein